MVLHPKSEHRSPICILEEYEVHATLGNATHRLHVSLSHGWDGRRLSSGREAPGELQLILLRTENGWSFLAGVH